jgi:hypothetical protein
LKLRKTDCDHAIHRLPSNVTGELQTSKTTIKAAKETAIRMSALTTNILRSTIIASYPY